MSKSRFSENDKKIIFSEKNKEIILEKIQSGQIDKAVEHLEKFSTPVWIREITTRQDKQKKYAILGRELGKGGFGEANEIIAFVKENPLSGKLEIHEDDDYVLKQGKLQTDKKSQDEKAITKEEKLDTLHHEIAYGRGTGLKNKPAFIEEKPEPESNRELDKTYYVTNFVMKKAGNLSLRHFLEIKYSDAYISTMQNTIINLKAEISKLNADIQTQEDRKDSASEEMQEAHNSIIERKKDSIASINQRIDSINQKIKTFQTNCESELGKQIQALTPAALIHLCYAVTKALADFQKLGLAHIDIKPDNILLDLSNPDYPKARLIDTGLSTHHEKLLVGKGSLYYMAPELIYLSSLDSVLGESSCRSQPTDQFSLGICLSNILGEFPENQRNEDGHSIIEIGKCILKNETNQNESLFNKHIQNKKSPLSSKAETAKEILKTLTHFLPENRYKNMSIALLEWENMLLVDYCATKKITDQDKSIENLFNKARQLRNQLFHFSHAKKSLFSSPEKHKMEVFENTCVALKNELSAQDSNKNNHSSRKNQKTDRWNDNNIEIFIRILDIDCLKQCKSKKDIVDTLKNVKDEISKNHRKISYFKNNLKNVEKYPNNYFKRNLKQYYVELETLKYHLHEYQHKLSKCKTLDDFVELKEKGDRVIERITAIINPKPIDSSQEIKSEKASNDEKKEKSTIEYSAQPQATVSSLLLDEDDNPTNKKSVASKPIENPHKKNEEKNQNREDYAGLISKRLMRVYKNPDQHVNAAMISRQLKPLTPEIQNVYLKLQAKAARECHFVPSESRLEVNLRHYHSVFFKPNANEQTQKNLQTKDENHILALLKCAHEQERSFFYKVCRFFGAREADDIQHNIKVIHALVAEFLKQSLSNHDDGKKLTSSPSSSSDQASNASNSFKEFLINNLWRLKLMEKHQNKTGKSYYETLDSNLVDILTDKNGIGIELKQITKPIPKPVPKDHSSSSTASTSSSESPKKDSTENHPANSASQNSPVSTTKSINISGHGPRR